MLRVAPEEPAAVQMENEDGQDKDNDESGGEEEYDGKEAGLVWRKLLHLNVLQLFGKLLQAVGKPLRGVVLVFHGGLDAVVC